MCNDGKMTFVQFQNLSADIDNDTKYLWTFGDGTESTPEYPMHNYNGLGK